VSSASRSSRVSAPAAPPRAASLSARFFS
jgi:hypothetical protein